MAQQKNHLSSLRRLLRKEANKEAAPQMQRYMKSEIPYHGVKVPLVRSICKSYFTQQKQVFENKNSWQDAIFEIWDHAQYREELYCAVNLARHRFSSPFITPASLPICERLVTEGAWWDIVDDVASHLVGDILKSNPAAVQKKLLAWSRSRDIWKRRTAILSQLGHKDEIDLDFLYACIEPSLDSDEFFLRKGIGWALRSHAWRDPKEVVRYVKENRERLSPLSKREALKNVLKKGLIKSIP